MANHGGSVRDWLTGLFCPRVLTLSSPLVEEHARKNGLTFSQLLAPFGVVENGGVPIRTPAGHSTTITDFRVRVVPAAYYAKAVPHEYDNGLSTLVKSIPPRTPPSDRLTRQQIVTQRDVKRYFQSTAKSEGLQAGDSTPWYTAARNELAAGGLCYEPFEQLHQPMAIVIAISSMDADPVATLKELQVGDGYPQALKDGHFSAQVPKFVVVVHDTCAAHTVDPRSVLHVLHGYFRPEQCKLLTLNSFPAESPNFNQPDMWSKELGWDHPGMQLGRLPVGPRPPPGDTAPPLPFGSLLSPEDLMGLQSFMTGVVTKGVSPEIERRMFSLNQEISASRKGFSNKLKSWWGRKPKEANPRKTQSGGPLYDIHSIECQIRLLGDLAFMIRDYDLAMSMYRMARDDYKSDRAWHHCASASGMLALAHHLSENGSRRDMVQAFEASIAYHTQSGGVDELRNPWERTRLSSRNAMFASEVVRAEGDTQLAARWLERAAALENKSGNGQFHMIVALLYEQSAMCTLVGPNPKLRRAARKFLLAGYHYAYCGSMPHSFHAYAGVALLYKETPRWNRVASHMSHTLGRQLSVLGEVALAGDSLVELMNGGEDGVGGMPKKMQGAILGDFFRIVSRQMASWGADKAKKRFRVQVPVIEDMDVRVLVLENHGQDGATGLDREGAVPVAYSCQPPGPSTGSWSTMEEDLDRHEGGWKAIQKPKLPRLKRRVVQNREPPQWCAAGETVFIVVRVRNPLAYPLRLLNFRPRAELINSTGEKIEGELGLQIAPIAALAVPPLSTERVCLQVVPNAEGVLSISGVEWEWEGETQTKERIPCERPFAFIGAPLNDSRRNSAAGARRVDCRNLVRVVGPRASLGAEILGISSTSQEGQISEGTIVLRNHGKVAVTSLRVFCDSPSVLLLHQPVQGTSPDGTAYDFGGVVIAPGGCEEIPVRLHTPRGQEKRTVRVLLAYAAASDEEKFVQRRVRLEMGMTVRPGPALRSLLRPHPSDAGKLLLKLMLTNGGDPIRLDKLIFCGPKYDVSPGPQPDSTCSLRAGESWVALWTLSPSTEGEAVRFFNVSKLCEETQLEFPERDLLLLENAWKVQEELSQADDDDEGDVDRPRTIEEIRERAQSRKESTGGIGTMEVPAPWLPESIAWGLDPGFSVVAGWSGQDRDVNGISQIVRVKPGVQGAASAKVENVEFVLSCDHPRKLRHDFASGPVGVDVVVHLDVRSTGPTPPFTFEAIGKTDFDWGGQTRRTFGAGVARKVEVPLRAVFLQPALHNICSFQISAGGGVYTFPGLQFLVEV